MVVFRCPIEDQRGLTGTHRAAIGLQWDLLGTKSSQGIELTSTFTPIRNRNDPGIGGKKTP